MPNVLEPIKGKELDSLSLTDLVIRMDKVLEISQLERYENLPSEVLSHYLNLKPTVMEFLSTKLVSQKSPDQQRFLVWLFFGFLVQMELCDVAGGISNRVLFDSGYHESESWRSPAFTLRRGVIRQFDVLSSRVAMDIFMDLLYAIDGGQRLASTKSKFKIFRKWLKDVDNPFVYFAHVLIAAYRFDRKHRTPEAHGSSKFPRRFLLLQVPDSNELSEGHQLYNILLNAWQPLKVILDGGKPNFGQLADGDPKWLVTYLTGSSEEVEGMLDDMFSEMET